MLIASAATMLAAVNFTPALTIVLIYDCSPQTHVPTHTHTNTYKQIQTHTHTHTYKHTHTHIQTHIHTHTHTHIHACTHTHTYTHIGAIDSDQELFYHTKLSFSSHLLSTGWNVYCIAETTGYLFHHSASLEFFSLSLLSFHFTL